MTGRFLQVLPWLTQSGLRLALPDLGPAVARGGPGLVVPGGPGPEDPPPAPAGFQLSPLACRPQRFALDDSSGSGWPLRNKDYIFLRQEQELTQREIRKGDPTGPALERVVGGELIPNDLKRLGPELHC
jgi:hypothetical protein